ncbi:hypothetical protein LOTGIDRAFT_238806 [Lottia gigantea]|uniref:Sulfatase N-terminal domain-containing protein n=1 Tax=Lottia gigantea TaxID=225164 RepID=V4B0G9_LOTGI|nr:hypothetical protein LOTGIDRAFT_238806 [Lottia gigantea]ESO99586.1 hypothetical protein LOTGIDRAFT_238806 [Lottia gigantea]
MKVLTVVVTLVAICALSGGQLLPNIVLILTDDQDDVLGSETGIPKTKELIGKQGMTFNNMFVSSPLCCPSRSSIFTSMYVHNHKGVNNSIDGNCNSLSWQQTREPYAFPVHLHDQGYQTFFAGKYLNTYADPAVGGVKHVPLGWDWWVGLVGNSRYYNYHLSVNGTDEAHGSVYEDDYLTDIIKKRGMEFLEQQSNRNPFFMMLSTPSCHEPFTPAPQYSSNFGGYVAPRNGSYNHHAGPDKHWLIRQAITPIPDDTAQTIDEIYRDRLRTLLSVDDMVEDVYNKLNEMSLLDNTYIIFTSDNGYHLGQFSMPWDKRQLYEFDIRVPLMVRGPGITPGKTSDVPVMNIDLGPTFLDIAQTSIPNYMDGISFKPTLMSNSDSQTVRENMLVEHYGEHVVNIPNCPQLHNQGLFVCHSHCECQDSWNNTYSCLRVVKPGMNYKYCEIEDLENFVEVYDLAKDPHEFVNLRNSTDQQLLTTFKQELYKLVHCSGSGCVTPPIKYS